MPSGIIFEISENQAVFKYENSARFLSAWVLSMPLTIAYLYMIVILFVSGINGLGDLLIIAAIVFFYFLIMIVSNASQAPLLNPQWILTARKQLILRNKTEAIFQYGACPICVRRRFPAKDIEGMQLMKQKWGHGLGFFTYLFSPVNLFSLTLTLKNRKMICLADNEIRNGFLLEEGMKLAEYLRVPFEDLSRPDASCFNYPSRDGRLSEEAVDDRK